MLANLEVSKLKASNVNPRFELNEIDELTASIKAVGLIQPIAVRMSGATFDHAKPEAEAEWIVIAGHRRLEACKAAGLKVVPCVIEDAPLKKQENMSVLHLVENCQRVDLTPVETALAVGQALKSGIKQKDLAKKLGKSTTWLSKFATIAKARAKADRDGVNGWMQDGRDYEAVYHAAREYLGLDKKEEQLEIEHKPDAKPEPDPSEEKGEVLVMRELQERAFAFFNGIGEAQGLDAKRFPSVSIVPVGTKGFRIALDFNTSMDAEAFVRIDEHKVSKKKP